MSYYRSHVFLCTYLRENGKKCCEQADATAACTYLKQRVSALGLGGKAGVRVSRSGCLGRCADGPCLVIYPEGVWYTYQSQADLERILQQHWVTQPEQMPPLEALKLAE